MTARHRIRYAIAAGLAALCIVTVPAIASAQGGGAGRRPGGAAPAIQLTRLEILEAAFTLNKDQKKTVKTILDEAHKNAAPIREALTRTRAAIAAAVQANKTQAEIDGAVNGYAEQAAAMTVLEMQALAQVIQALDKDQRANAAGIQSAFFLMRGIFVDNKRWDEIPDARGY